MRPAVFCVYGSGTRRRIRLVAPLHGCVPAKNCDVVDMSSKGETYLLHGRGVKCVASSSCGSITVGNLDPFPFFWHTDVGLSWRNSNKTTPAAARRKPAVGNRPLTCIGKFMVHNHTLICSLRYFPYTSCIVDRVDTRNTLVLSAQRSTLLSTMLRLFLTSRRAQSVPKILWRSISLSRPRSFQPREEDE